MSYLKTSVLSHTQRVCRLYKAALRTVEDYVHHRPSLRYNVIIMRQRFDENKDIKDMVEAKRLLEAGEKELFEKRHYQPKKFTFSEGGVAHERSAHIPDWVLDYWHPLEKAQYPKYFATREKRKKEFVEMWEKKYGKSESTDEELTK